MKIRSHLRGIGFWLVALTFVLSPMLVCADCEIVGTINGGYIVSCTGETGGFCIGAGNDIITVELDAKVSHAVQQFPEAIASANATAIAAGSGNNRVTNYGSVGATAEANALPVDETASQAEANAAGISAGDGADVIQNFSTIAATATSNSESGDISLTLEGNNQSQSVTTSTATAIGIDGGAGNNEITNAGAITATATSEAEAPFIDLNLTDTAYADVSVKAHASGTGISAYGYVVNEQTGSITVTVSSQATAGNVNANIRDSSKADLNTIAQATATGIAGIEGNDTITTAGTITVNATSNAEGRVDLESRTDAEINATIESKATATGIDSGEGNDTIINDSTLGTTSTASVGSDNVNTSIWAPGVTDTTTKSTAVSTGILSGLGEDVITNKGSITVYSEATNEVSNVLLSGGIEVALPTDVKGGATSEATAIGVDAGDGEDNITNNSTISASSKATTSSEGVLLTLVGIGTFATPTTATVGSIGIDAGAGKDEITNSGTITANATSRAEALSVSVSAFQYEVASDGDAKTESVASATGIAGGDGDDKVTHKGTIEATAHSIASTTDISVELLGASRSNSSTTADAFATGINGGIGNDEISNSGTITASATSEVDAVGVDVKYIRLPIQPAQWFGADLGDAKTAAQATAKGVDSSEGDNTIDNSGTIDVYAKADSDSDNISAALTITPTGGGTPQAVGTSAIVQGTATTLASVATTPLIAAGAENSDENSEMIDTGTIAQAIVTGIESGSGNDTITNKNKIAVKAESEADSVSVSGTISISKGSLLNIFPGFALTDGTTTAQSTAAGIDGGAGNDTITNTNELRSEAISNSTSASVSAFLKGVKEKGLSWGGTIVSDSTTKAISKATGIDGGEGNDTITNSGKIKATATPDADSASIGVTLMGVEEGLAAGFTYVDATTTADATAIGIDGASGNDIITNSNTGEITVTGDSESASASIGVMVSGAFSQEWSAAIGGAITDGTTKAISNVAGIKGGEGEDTITNSGKIISNAFPDADSASVSATLAGAQDGLTVGFTYADSTTTAEANAVGIDGGSANDTITNTSTGQIEVTADPTSSSASVSATITGVTKGTGIVGGAALTDGTTKAISNVAGIKGGDGDDTITNSGKIIVKSNPDADSASVAVNLGAAMGELGLVGGFSYADATTTSQSNAIGIDGGVGNDTVTNTGEVEVTTVPTASSASIGITAQGVKGMGAAVGISLTDGTTKAISASTGIAGGEGDDTITNSGKITVNALPDVDSASVSVSLSAAKEGLAAGGTFADNTTTAQATATGIDGAEGKEIITNSGTIDVTADSESSSASVSFSGQFTMTGATLGVALSDGTTKAISTSTGMSGGDGDDTITNSHITTVTSTADVAAASVSVNAGVAVDGAAVGGAFANANTEATSSAIGLEGGTGNDTLTNRGSNTVSATSEVSAASVAVSLEGTRAGLAAGISLVDGENRAGALAIGISGGDGDDTIHNETGASRVKAATTSTRTNVSVTGTFSLYGAALGASAADATNIASADARGIEGGGGNDTITNSSNLVMGATTTADSTSMSVSANVAIFGAGAGASLASAETTGSALATGIDGGEGDNTIINASNGSINATSTAHAHTVSVGVNLIGAVKASADSTATATSTGMRGGNDTDFIQNDGRVVLTATSDTDASSYAAQLVGYGESNAKGISNAMVMGIDGGDGNNTIVNTSTGLITGTATALADASSYDIQLSGGGKATAGTEATATAIGIAGGKDIDTIRNEGTINLTSQSTLVSNSRSYKFFGVGIANADSKAETFATGIGGGEGNNTIINTTTGSIDLSSNASATVTSMSANIGVAGASASTTSKALSMGIKSGGAQDIILNEGSMNVTATSSTGAASGDFSVLGLAFGDSLTEAIAEGINAGDEKDTIINTGSITVGSVQDNDHPMAYAEVASVSFSLFNISSATFGSKAQATGIIGGGGEDTILNTGTITVGDDDWMAKGRGYGFSGNFFEFFSLTSVGTTAEAISTGIEGGDGNDTLINDTSGVLSVKATSYSEAEGAADNTFGDLAAFASSTTKATATGMSGGGGDDEIGNKGMISVGAKTWANAYSDAEAGWGGPTSDAAANATATASGIDAGKGQNLVTNEGQIAVNSAASATPIARSNADIGRTEAESTAYAKALAFGILAGDEGNTVMNMATGSINVTATARTDDGLGNIAKAFQDVDARATAGMWDYKANKWLPVTANAAGISLGDGADLVYNDGVIKVGAKSFPSVNAYTSSNVYTARSHAKTYSSAIAKGIAAGVGENEVINNGQISVSAWSHGNPITDSWSRDQTATANAVAESSATVSGIEGDGNIVNTSLGNIDVKARATTNAYANTSAETATPTATLVAAATGIGTTSSAGSTVRDRLWNDGNITVTAVAGEDENGNNQEIAYADTDTWVRSCRADATGTSTVDATGIRVGERGAEITNNGNLEVSGLAHAYLRAYADSRDYHPRGNAYSTAIAKATGISAAGGDNLINNYSTMKVEARVQDAYARGDTWSSWSTCRSLAETNATATAKGIQTGAGKDEIKNYGQLTVVADADAESYAWADTRDNNLADEYETTTAKAQADAVGIDAGAGNNLVNHSGSMSVSAVANARAGAGGGHASVTRTEQAVSSAIGIQTGSDDDSIVIRSDSNLVATAEGTANDANVRATGIDAGDGINFLQSQSSISVAANAISGISGEAEVWGIKTGSSSDRIVLGTGSLINTAAHATSSSDNGVTNTSAIGIDAGEGTNQITNYGVVNSNADATAEVKRIEILGWSITYPATANSSVTGIKSGNELDIINNYGEIMVNSKASAVINQVLDLSAGTKSATANAIGIEAGSGDNFIANYGTIDVSALAAAGTGANPKSRTDGVENTTAIGIMTGDGDDTIINGGTIHTANQRLEWVGGWIHITSQPGIGISSGGGNDQLFLMDGSETNGHIDLGDGDDWLTFVGTPLVAGDVTGAAGTDSLVFEGAGNISFTPAAFENAIKQGAGTYSVASLPTMQRIEVNQGTLQINNDYAMANDSTFQTNVNGDGSHGQLKVNGTAELAGALNVIKGPGPYTNGTTYDIIEANTLNGLFSNVMLPTPTPLLSFEMNQLPNSVEIETSAKNFTTVAKNRVHWIIADYLDKVMPLAKGDLSGVLEEIQNLSEPGEFNTAFSSLSPGSYDNYTRGTLFATQQYKKSLQYRMNNVRYHFMAGSPDNEKPIILAYSGSDASLGQLLTPGQVSQSQDKNGLWLDAFGQWGDQNEEDGYTGYDYFMRGATLGFDHRLMDKLMAGLSLGYSRSDIDLGRDQGSGDVKSLFGSLYGSYFDKYFYIDAILSYGRNWYDNSRKITIGGILREARSDHDAHLLSGYLGGGYYFDFNPWAFGPYGSLQYIRLDEESFTERGAGAISLRVDDRQTDALFSELGLRMVGRFKGKYGNLLPEVSLGWSYDFDIDDHVVRAAFAGSPGASFSIEGQDVERNGLVVGAGLTFIHKSGFSTSFRYKGEFRDDYKSNGVMGEIRYVF